MKTLLALIFSIPILALGAGSPYVINFGTSDSNFVNRITTTNFHARALNPGTGVADTFRVDDGSLDPLLWFYPIAASKSNYFTLFFGSFGVTNTVNANLSDIFFRQSNVGYHAIEFGDETNSFWIVASGTTHWDAWAGDLGGAFTSPDPRELFDSDGNLFYQGLNMTNSFPLFSTFSTSDFSASTAGVKLANPISAINVTTLTISGTASNSVQINGTNGAMILGINPTNNAVTIGAGGLKPAGVPAGANFYGGLNYMATNVGAIFTTTNAIVLGTRYTAPSRAFITASFTLNGAVAGTAIVTLYVEGTVTNKLSISAGPLASLTVADTLSGMVGPSEVYYFADESSGSGATVAFVANTFSRKLW